MPNMTAKITEEGRLVLPPEVLEQLGIKPGDEVWLHIDDQQMIVERKPGSFHEFVGTHPLPDGIDARTYVDQMRHDADDRAALDAGEPHPNITSLGRRRSSD
ncbi:AbrB/MazE/SpoVT family DNA-binding domain-containing protein [Deinococcus ruber]|nr:AbrB/MazE/SpoVT family DNA-binding domain-containing protein [Deinococcus ruber]